MILMLIMMCWMLTHAGKEGETSREPVAAMLRCVRVCRIKLQFLSRVGICMDGSRCDQVTAAAYLRHAGRSYHVKLSASRVLITPAKCLEWFFLPSRQSTSP